MFLKTGLFPRSFPSIVVFASSAVVILSAVLVLTGCGPASGGGDAGYLESVKGCWCTGIKSNVKFGDDPAMDCAALLVMENPSFEFYLLGDSDGNGVLDLGQGWKGKVEDIDEDSITFLVQQEYDRDNDEWDPLGQYSVLRYSLDADTMSMILDMNEDSVFDGTHVVEDDAVIPENTDVKLYAVKEPEEGLTVTGTITFDPAYHDGDGSALGVGLWRSDPTDPEHSRMYTVDNETATKDYSFSGVTAGIYSIGASVDLGTQGNYHESEDWLGSYKQSVDPPNAPVFSGHTTFDFDVNEPQGEM